MSTSTAQTARYDSTVIITGSRCGPRVVYISAPTTEPPPLDFVLEGPPAAVRGAKRDKKGKRKKDWHV